MEYVLCYAHCKSCGNQFNDDVLVCEKKKPAWQAGKLNLPGGAIEYQETPHEAAVRELKEECNIVCDLEDVKLYGTLTSGDSIVYVMYCGYYVFDTNANPDSGAEIIEAATGQESEWFDMSQVLDDPRLINNLRYIIPWMRCGVTGWTLTETDGNIEITYKDVNTSAA